VTLTIQQQVIDESSFRWSRTLVDWAEWRDEKLTEHRNWWPEVYAKAREHWGVVPDPKMLAYNATYESIRPDMHAVEA
jgi:hypothetical protein